MSIKVEDLKTADAPNTSRKAGRGVVGGIARALTKNELPEDVSAAIEEQIAGLAAQCGPAGPTPQQSITLGIVKDLLLAKWRFSVRVSRGVRNSKHAAMLLLSVSNSLGRHLKALNLPDKPKPRCLADLFPPVPPKVAPKPTIPTPRPPISAGKCEEKP